MDPLSIRVDRSNRIVAVGGPWDEVAIANGGAAAVVARVLGTGLLDHVHGDPARMLVLTVLDRVRRFGTPRTVPYRCDTPGLKRWMEMTLTPAPDGTVTFEHRLLRCEPMQRPVRFAPARPGAPRGPAIIRCSSCNRVRDASGWHEPDTVRFSAEAVGIPGGTPPSQDAPILVGYGVCEACRARIERMLAG
ncbi:hypothetical protein CCR97_08795 [Rhodoplanes elegans]|uniref:Uncharacterized protein n=1 Tax=Rhodoplanes elegans TaxID=29408 RepID=A0A327K3X4_9BRAD|nr:hypothetical protein [Rhodoplanes elegans]MBK5958307.1 hypothetical protein [Rhodoplanes elegans]RAI32991.1 hypothetical protein CH338_23290 [Rhodoplanes elegans]